MSIVGYPSSWRGPFSAVELSFGQGPSNAPAGPRNAIYVMPKTSAGTATVNTVYEVRNELQAIQYGGTGSPLHRAVRKHFSSWKNGRVYICAYAATSGGSPATATGTVTFSGTITAAGTTDVYVCGEKFSVSYGTSGAVTTPSLVAAAMAAAINGATHLPCTASAVGAVLTLTARIAGASQGDGTVGVIRFRSVYPAGTGLSAADSGAALGLGTSTAGADGSTTETANLTAALATLESRRDYYMGFSAWSAAALAPVKSHIHAKSLPNPGLRCRGFAAYTGTQSAGATIAIGLNHERLHQILQTKSELDAASLVGQVLAVHQAEESVEGEFVPDNYTGRRAVWSVPAVATDADWPDDVDVNDALVDGQMIIASSQAGARLVMSVNTRSKDSGGTIDDFRASETHRVSFMDYFADTWLLRDVQAWYGFKLVDDERLPDGTINHNQKIKGRTTTPHRYGKWFAGIVTEMLDIPILQGATEWKASLVSERDPLNAGRIVLSASGRCVDILHQRAVKLSETNPG